MPNTTLTLKSLKRTVELMLGASGVAVELTDEDLSLVVRQALQTYNQYRSRRNHAALTLVSGQVKYPIVHPGLQGVLHVAFVQGNRPDIPDPFYSGLYYQQPSMASGGVSYGELDAIQGHLESARRVTSTEMEWHGQWEGSSYYLYISHPRPNGLVCSYQYSWHITPDDNATTGLLQVPNGDVPWIEKYATALAKTILGRILRKHGGVPTPEGGTEPLDGDQLSTEGQTEQEQLTEQLKLRRPPLPPVLG